MKKINYLFLAGIAGLASCANNEYLGEGENPENVQENNGAILFSTRGAQVTRGGELVGADAATLLNKNFVVAGFKGGTLSPVASVTTNTVFDHYDVGWADNTAGTTASCTSDWEYVGKAKSKWNSTLEENATQTIKYWDYSVGQYDFIAFSTGSANNVVKGTSYEAGKLTISPVDATKATTNAYTVSGNKENLANFYIADLVTAYNSANTATLPSSNSLRMGQEVKLTFRNLASKVRLAFYETVPGYSIKDVKFYTSSTATTNSGEPTLFTSGDNFYTAGTYTVYYPTVDKNMSEDGKQASDYNKAHVKFNAASAGASKTFTDGSALNYTRAQGSTKFENEKYLGESSNEATYASATKDYTIALPNESSSSLSLRVDYTLVSNDGSKETITVHGATAEVPAHFCQWKSNYAYTYVFKISDKTNGQTQELGKGPEGLTPITFDAVVVDSKDGLQETVTTVAVPSITTYMKDAPNVTGNNEYLSGRELYIMVQDQAHLGAIMNNLATKGKLYSVTGSNAITTPITEANVMDALNIVKETDNDKITGWNTIVLDPVTLSDSHNSIPGVDNNAITKVTVFSESANKDVVVSKDNVALLSSTESDKTYAYVYEVSDVEDTYFNQARVWKTTDAPKDWGDIKSTLFTDFEMNTPATTYEKDKVYYQKLTNKNTTYAVKVIKIKN